MTAFSGGDTVAPPERHQFPRGRKGWRKPPGARFVTRATSWGNPYRVSDYLSPTCDKYAAAPLAVADYRAALLDGLDHPELDGSFLRFRGIQWQRDHIAELAGVSLVCYCPLDSVCHADLLIELAAAAAS